jgi:glycerol-3-phosphate acyltransferase PlsY
MLNASSALAAFRLPAGAEWLAVAAAYLIGAIPFGLVIAKAKGVDLRKVGSGNIGATNAMRGLGRRLGYFVFALDVLKGAVPVFACSRIFAESGERALSLQILCGTAAVLGHCFPVYIGFKGGKGVATACGALIALDFWVFAIGGFTWLAVFFTTHYTGLASMCMGAAFAAAAWLSGAPSELSIACTLLAALILVRHRSNMARMIAGTEPRAGAKREIAARAAQGDLRDER